MTGSVLLVAMALAASQSAPVKDVVVLRNGDQLTGEIKELSRGRVELSTDSMGTVYVEWEDVARFTASNRFEVETVDGTLYLGTVGMDAGGRVAVTTAAGVSMLDSGAVIRISPIRQSFFRRIDGSLDVGFSFTKASGVAQLSASLDTNFRRPAYQYFLSFSGTFTRQPDADDTSRESMYLGNVRFLQNNWALMTLGFLERNEDLGFDFRGTGGFGVGKSLVKSNRGFFRVVGGLAYSREVPIDAPGVNNLDAMIVMGGEFYTYDFPKTEVAFASLVFPGVSNAGRVRLEVRGKLRRELAHDFYLAVTMYESYDSEPPVAGVDENDVGVTLSLGWTF
jgi:hypothetical protein